MNHPSVGDVRGRADLVFVARDEYPVLRHDEIGLDVIGALLDREEIRCQRVLRNIAAGTAVTDHERRVRGVFAGVRGFVVVRCHGRHDKP